MSKWIVQVLGTPDAEFEISVLREGHRSVGHSWGWFDEGKLLIAHNGCPIVFPFEKSAWSGLIKVAEDVASKLNVAQLKAAMAIER